MTASSLDSYHPCHLSLQLIIAGFCPVLVDIKCSVCPLVRFLDINTTILARPLFVLKLTSLNYFREKNIWCRSAPVTTELKYPLKILNISTIIGFQHLAEIFMASNIKMKSLSGFNINKLGTEEIPWQAINSEIDTQLVLLFNFENTQ